MSFVVNYSVYFPRVSFCNRSQAVTFHVTGYFFEYNGDFLCITGFFSGGSWHVLSVAVYFLNCHVYPIVSRERKNTDYFATCETDTVPKYQKALHFLGGKCIVRYCRNSNFRIKSRSVIVVTSIRFDPPAARNESEER